MVMSNPGASEQPIDGPKCIEIPRGWNRILENGSILYISPNNSRLRSLDHVIEYLKTEGTCKCGLDCPLFVQNIFNFDARIPSKLIPVGTRPEPSKSGCKHCVTDYSDVVNSKQSVDITAKQSNDATSPAISTLGQKRGPGRPRNPLSKSRRVGVRKPDLDRPMSPLHNLPLPVPSSVLNSPVQSVPTNIAVEQRPLPSFATIVSSSKLFNSGASLGSNTILGSSVVTTATNSAPLTTATLHSSKPAIITSSVAVSSSSTSTNSAVTATSTGVVITQASKTTAPVTSTVAVSQQHAVTVTAQLPTRTRSENALTKSTSSPGLGTKSSPLNTSVTTLQGPRKVTSVSSSITSVVSTSAKTFPAAVKPEVRPVASLSKVQDVKVSPKAPAARSNKPSKAYSGRKTVAATLKAERLGIDNTFKSPQAVTTSSTGPCSDLGTTTAASKPSPQALPTCVAGTSSTTVQAPALFHSVLKDAIVKEQGQSNRVVSSPSTNAAVPPLSYAMSVHVPRAAQTISTSSRNKSSTPKEAVPAATAAVVQGVHVPSAVPQHVQAHRPQPSGTGHPLVNTASTFYSAVSLAASATQPPNAPSASVAQGTTHVVPSSASVYGQVHNTVASTQQIPSLQLTASQGQGGVFFQGSGNQVFQMNVDSNQLKGTYLHGAVYQGAIPATFLAATNASKPASSNALGAVPQALYTTNPYMLGIVMPTTITQSASNSPAQSAATTATSPSATAVAAASVASYPYNNQNAAIAAAFESFVPIAPAAAPRFSQTLAHLASAYTPFVPRSAVQGNTPVQFAAQRMVPMSAMHSQAGGNGQMGPTILNLTDYTVKYPMNTVKPGSHPSQTSTASNVGSANTHPQTAVVAAMPYVAFGQINNPRFPFSVNFAASGASTNPSTTSSSTSPSCSFVTSVTTSHQYTPGSNADSHGGCAALGYASLPVPFVANPSGVSQSQSAPNTHPGSAFSPPSHTSVSHGNHRPLDSSGAAQQLPSWCSASRSGSGPAVAGHRRCSTPESNNSGSSNNSSNGASSLGHSSITNSCTSGSCVSSRTSFVESSSSGTALKISASNCSQSPRHPGVSSPLNSPLPMPLPTQGLSACQGSRKSSSPLATVKSGAESVSVGSQSFGTFEGHQVKTSSEMSSTLKRPYNDISEPAKKTKFDESAYYEANPLLGLKRSCEAIEAFCSPEREEENDEDDGLNDSAVPKNDQPSPVNEKAGEGNVNNEPCGKLKNSDQNDESNESNSTDSQATPAGIQPITDQHLSHSVYNGDISGNQNEELREPMVSQEPYLPVKTIPVPPNTTSKQAYLEKPHIPNIRPQFEIGDVVWAQARGLPSWPGKVVDASEVGKASPDDGKRWVMWFGDHTFSQVEVDRLKTLSEGLRTLDDKARKKKYKAKKTRIGLEQAISEALEALETRERLRGRQAARSKAKKKRIR